MDLHQSAELLRMLALIHQELRRMADAAEAQVAETQNMRLMVEANRLREEQK